MVPARPSETDSPLSLVAAGVPVAGEPVAVHDAARRGSSATPNQREASEGRLLGVTGFGLSDNTALGLEERALVAFLQLTGTDKGERRRLEVLRDRAVVATEMSFTITDPRRTDDPLVWVNPAFTRLTGYSPAEVVGRNCRFLQGDATDRAAISRITRALDERVPITEVLLNYRRDGTAFWNQVSISPVFDGEGELVNFVGVQNDVTERVIVEQERRAALAEAEEARGYLRLLAEATTEMTAAPDVDGACNRLARIVVPHLADLCAVDLFDRPGEGTARRVAVAARNPADEAQLHGLAQAHRYRVDGTGPPPRCSQAANRNWWPSCPTPGPPASPTTPRPPPRSTGSACARRSSCRCGPAVGCSARSRSTPSTPTAAATPRATCTSPPTSRAGRPWPSTTPGSTRPSTPR
jgi:PAS domain S-box-containing protein